MRYEGLSLRTVLENLIDAEEHGDEACVAAMEAELERRGIYIPEDGYVDRGIDVWVEEGPELYGEALDAAMGVV